jgi:tetratricopeptide (TPR) repeat protein
LRSEILRYQTVECKVREPSRGLSGADRKCIGQPPVRSRLIRVVIAALALSLLQGCQSMGVLSSQAAGDGAPADSAPPVMPFPEPAPRERELDEDLVYSYLLGEIAAHRGELQLAQSHYQHAAVLASDAYAAERATRIALHLKDYDAALTSVGRWVELAPNDATARQLAAILLLRSGDADAALEELDAVVRIAEARGNDGFLQAASALGAEPDAAAAEQLMLRLRERYPDDVRALYALAVLETAQRRFAEAETRLREVIGQKPDWEQPRVLLSRVLVAQDRRPDALELLDQSVRQMPSSAVLRTAYSRLLIDAGDYPEALEQFRQLHAAAPDEREITFGYAMLATQQSRWDEARPLWQALRGDPDRRDEAGYYLAQIEERAGNDELALGLYRTVNNDELRVDAAMRIARILAGDGRLAEARETLQQARIANPGRAADLYIAETQIVQKHGERDEALALYDLAMAAFPEDNDLLYNRALFINAQGDFAAMERDLRRVLERDPDHADALNALGYSLADRN